MVSFLKKYLQTWKSRLSPEIQLQFLCQLSRLLEHGYPLLNALNIIKWDKQLIPIADKVILSLKNGGTIDEALDGAQFHHLITSYLFFSRTNSDLTGSIKKCLLLFENRLEYTKKIRQVTRYPLILLFFFSVLLYFIKNSILPTFIDLFQTSSDASSTAVILLMIIEFLSTVLIVVVTLLLLVVILWHINKQKMSVEMQLKIYSFIPIYRQFLRMQTTYLFSTHISTLLEAGMPIKNILQNMTDQEQLPIITYYSNLMINELRHGYSVANLLSELPFFEKQLANIFRNNLSANDLSRDLSVYAELLTEKLHHKVMKYIAYIQPVFLVLVASFIIFIYVTLMWPMFELIKAV